MSILPGHGGTSRSNAGFTCVGGFPGAGREERLWNSKLRWMPESDSRYF